MLRRLAALLAGVSAAAIAAPVVDKTASSPVTNVSQEQLENLPTARRLDDLLRTCPAQSIPTVTRPAGSTPATPASGMECVKPDDLRMIEIYKAHNQARFEVGSRPLVWDPLLAAQAASYGPELAQYGRPVHSSRIGRETSRENLLQALPGTSPAAMMGFWTGEKKNFVNGVFPNVSRTGNWADVGHYTQLVWPTTTNLGCAIHTSGQFDWLICRYSPPGNKDGKMVLRVEEKNPPKPVDRIFFCSPGSMAAYDVRIPWNSDKSKPPPESILDDVGEGSAGPPPESILDDVGDASTKPPPTKASAPPPESILDEIDDGAAKSVPAKAGGDKPNPMPAQGLSAGDEQSACWLLQEVSDVESGVAALERDGWGDDGYRAEAARRLRGELLEEKRFPPDSVRRWIERVDKVLDKLTKGAATP